jgi:hypothetical protein
MSASIQTHSQPLHGFRAYQQPVPSLFFGGPLIGTGSVLEPFAGLFWGLFCGLRCQANMIITNSSNTEWVCVLGKSVSRPNGIPSGMSDSIG